MELHDGKADAFQKQDRNGKTLLETLTAVAVVAVLGGLVTTVLDSGRRAANELQVANEERQTEIAQLAAYDANSYLSGTALPMSSAAAASLHANKAGIYGRLSGVGTRFDDHPLLDAVVLQTAWAAVEPKKGTYNFSAIASDVARWGAAGKGTVVLVMLYGQATDDSITPAWLWRDKTVRQISFSGGGTAQGGTVRIPAVWDAGFAVKYIKPLATALAKQFGGDANVWYVMPGCGHIGNLTCQPSSGGATAVLAAGWTIDQWTAYCRNVVSIYRTAFKQRPLLLKAAGFFIRDRQHDNYTAEADALLAEFGLQGTAVIHFGLSNNLTAMQTIAAALTNVIPVAETGQTRIGLGDDWPLWVPEDRRGDGPTEGRDDAFLAQALTYAFGGVEGLPEVPTSILWVQEPELDASLPGSSTYVQEVFDLLTQCRDRLKEN